MTSIIYEVNVAVDAGKLREYLAWLKPHMAQMKALPGFLSAELFVRDLSDEAPRHSPDATRAHVTALYRLEDHAALTNYMENHSAAMRADGTERFGGTFSAWRRVLTSICSDAELSALDPHSIPAPSQTTSTQPKAPESTTPPVKNTVQSAKNVPASSPVAEKKEEGVVEDVKDETEEVEVKKDNNNKKDKSEEEQKNKKDKKKTKDNDEEDEEEVDEMGVPLKDKEASTWIKGKLDAEVKRFRSTAAAAQWRIRPLAVKNTGIVRESKKRTLNRIELDVPLDFRAVGEILVSPPEPVPAKPGYSATFVICVPKEDDDGTGYSWPERTMGIMPYIFKTDKRNSLAHWAFINSEGVRTRLEVRGAKTIEEEDDDDDDDETVPEDGDDDEEVPALVQQ